MARIGTTKMETPSGAIELPVFDSGDGEGEVIEPRRVGTPSGVGFIPMAPPSGAAYPYTRIQTGSGVYSFHDGFSLASFSDNTVGSWLNTFGSSNGDITVSNQELTITQTAGGGSNTNRIGVISANTYPVGTGFEIRSKNTEGRHAAIVGLTEGGTQAFPHDSGGDAGVTLYSRADAVTATTSYEDESGNTGTGTPATQDYRNYRTLRIEYVSSTQIDIYVDGTREESFDGPNFGSDYHFYLSADGNVSPNTIVVDYITGYKL